jgi:hypothetical protein
MPFCLNTVKLLKVLGVPSVMDGGSMRNADVVTYLHTHTMCAVCIA